MSLIQQYGNVLAAGTFNATTTGGLVAGTAGTNSGRAAALLAGFPNLNLQNGFVSNQIWGFRITNNDPTNAVYLTSLPGSTPGQNLPSSTNFSVTLGPGQSFERSGGPGVFNRLQITSAAAPVACQLEVLG